VDGGSGALAGGGQARGAWAQPGATTLGAARGHDGGGERAGWQRQRGAGAVEAAGVRKK
jgi:hypothetical protein